MIRAATIWLAVSLATIVLSVLIIVTIRPVWGIDFTGGSLLEVSVTDSSLDRIREVVDSTLDTSAAVQAGEANRILIKAPPLSETEHQALLGALREADILDEELRFESIGPTIGAELRRKAIVAISIVVVTLIAYLAYTFRQASHFIAPWKFGLAAVYALVHDLLVVMTLFVILGRVASVPIDTLFVTAMLAILGYSVNDSIVIFNRLKTEWKATSGGLLDVLDAAARHSLIRSLNTSLTTLLVLTALLFLGGSTIRWFIVALAAGTVVGTYSSLFVAPPALYFLAKK